MAATVAATGCRRSWSGCEDVDILPRRHLAAICTTIAAVVVTFLPWARSGDRVRTSHELVDVADRAGVLPDGLGTVAPLWYLVPFLAGVAVIALATGRHRLGGGLTTSIGVLVGAGGLLLHRSPLVVRYGANAGLVVGTIAVVVGLVSFNSAAEEHDSV